MTDPADLVLTGVRIHGADDPAVDSLAVRGDRILAVGPAADVRDRVGPGAETRHLPGGLVVPGFQDAHVHPPQAGRNRLTVDLDGLTGVEAYVAAVAQYASAHPEAEWVTGGGWAMEHFPGGTPTRELLDAVVPDRPVFLFNRDVHGAWVNSVALARAGIDRVTPDPPDGRIERDPVSGEPTGTLHEGAAYTLSDRLVPPPTAADWDEAILAAQAQLHAYGITGWQDAWVTPDTQAAYQRLAASGRLTARVVGALWWERERGVEQIPDLLARRGSTSHATVSGIGFHPTSVKIMLDGVLENFTGAMLEPYCDGHGGHGSQRGLTYLDPDVHRRAVVELDRLGFQVHHHAIGDRANRMALDAIEAARRANPDVDNRHHIAHIQVVQPADLPRFAELGVVANAQAYWAQSEPQMDTLTIPFLGPKRAELQYPFAGLLRAGARLAMGSDWPVTTANPLEQIEVAVTRVDPEHRDNGPFLPAERLSVGQAVDAFTAGSAFVNHDADAGRLSPGRRADLAVLDRDIRAIPGREIADASVVLTLSAGRVVHG
ncbi:MAG: amidohydrolase [Actinomycetales bacterium]